jgi:hypothetical protein
MAWWNNDQEADRARRIEEMQAQLPPMTDEADQAERDAATTEALRKAAEAQRQSAGR